MEYISVFETEMPQIEIYKYEKKVCIKNKIKKYFTGGDDRNLHL
jgi:hypothetical protein